MNSSLRITVNGETFEVEVVERSRGAVTFMLGERVYRVELEKEAAGQPVETGRSSSKRPSGARVRTHASQPGEHGIIAPIPGVIVEVLVVEGQAVREGEVLLRLEAMKMQNNIASPAAGTVTKIHVAAGTEVGDGELLLELGTT